MAELISDAAMAQDIGARHRQEDAAVVHAVGDGGPTLAILSDGMGGHEDGDLASRIILGGAFSGLFLAAARPRAMQSNSRLIFDEALNAANRRLKENIDAKHISESTGGTLICASVYGGQLRWMSVGDSLLYLWRDGQVRRLNDIHSFGAQLDKLVAKKQLTRQEAETHPDRNCLTSAVTGQDVPKVDCPEAAVELKPGDIILLASDGIDALGVGQLRALIDHCRSDGPRQIAAALLAAVTQAQIPDQDNTSVIVIKVATAPEAITDVRRTWFQGLSAWPIWGRHRRVAGLRT